MSSKPYSEACERNREPIAAALDPWMGDRHRVLEIGSGTGQHAAFFAERWPWLRWQPSDHPDHLPGIEAWRAEAALLNLLPPVALQVELPPAPGLSLPQGSTFDAAFSANTLHIMSWEHVQALFAALPPVLRHGAAGGVRPVQLRRPLHQRQQRAVRCLAEGARPAQRHPR
jgi:SAM-dependent methyltransferase